MIAAFKNQVQQNEATEDKSEDESNGSAHLQSTASSVKSSDGDGEDQEMDMDIDSGVASDALKEIEQFDQLELQHDVVFSVQKRLSCFNHTLQLVVRMFDTIQSSKRALQSAHRLAKKFSKSVKATEIDFTVASRLSAIVLPDGVQHT